MYITSRFVAWVLLAYVIDLFCCSVFEGTAAGGRKPVPTNSAEVKSAALFAVSKYNTGYSQQSTAFKTIRIVSAERQVVAGLKYYLTVKLGLTRCSKTTTGAALQACPLQTPSKVLLCDFVVTEIPWQNVQLLAVTRCVTQ